MSDWKPELDAIVGARHGGQTAALLTRIKDLDTRCPNVPEIAYQLAWTLDILGRPAQALPHYERSLALGLAPNEQGDALIGLANCLRLTGEAARAVEILESARRQFPDHRELDAFLALALQAAGRGDEAVKLLLDALLDTTEDPGLTAYQRALRHHASTLSTGR